MNIAIVGTGYVGLVSGTCFAELGIDVTCVDVDREKIAKITRGEMPIYEPGLEELVKKNVEEGRLHFTTDLVPVLDRVSVVLPLWVLRRTRTAAPTCGMCSRWRARWAVI